VADNQSISTPLPLLLRRVRYQIVPVLTLVVSAALAGWLWVRRGASTVAMGEANAIRVNVNCKSDGVLAELPRKLQLFEYVKAGEVLARLDNSMLDAQISKLQSEIDQMRVELETLSQPPPKSKAPATQPGGPAHGQARPAGPAGQTSPLVALVPPTAAEGTDESDTGVYVPRTQASLRIAMATREAKIRELEQKILNHDIKSPIAGIIVEIHRVPGQAVMAGHTIVTIAADKPDFIVSYIRFPQQIQPTPGMVVDIRRRTDAAVIRTRVDSVGPQLEPVPARQLQDHRTPEWGVPVHIVIPPGANLRPGEIVDLFFTPSGVRNPG
jgi:multidrug resistance efflux pump